MQDPWVMPNWMEKYRPLINNTGGNSIEDLINDKETNAMNNLIRSALILAVESQVNLLFALHQHNHLDSES
jgi:hypothetical protein